MRYLILLHCIIIFFTKCSNHEIENKEKSVHKNNSTISDSISDEESEQCLSSFKLLKEVHLSGQTDLYLSGKGWDPENESCTLTWGEYIYNESPSNYNTNLLNIFLVDLDSANFNSRDLNALNNFIISTYHSETGKGMYCIFDPFKTGKYPKPKQWQD